MDPRFAEAFRGARRGDPRAFRTVADMIGPELVRYLTTVLRGDVHAAHDVAQDVLMRAWAQLDQIHDPEHLRRWCYRVARCKAVSWIRRRRPGGRRFEPLDAGCANDGYGGPARGVDAWARPTVPDDGGDLAAALRRAMLDLPANYAGPVHLHYVQGLSTRETAKLLGITRQTVKMRLHRARAWLRRAIHRQRQHARRPFDTTPRRTP